MKNETNILQIDARQLQHCRPLVSGAFTFEKNGMSTDSPSVFKDLGNC